eukprot:5782386-Alexandrium_andersonii.AAC.1
MQQPAGRNATVNTCSTAEHAVQALPIHPGASRRTSGTTVHGHRGGSGRVRAIGKTGCNAEKGTTIGKTG